MKKIFLLSSALAVGTISFAQTETKIKIDGDEVKIKSGDTKIKKEKGSTKIKTKDSKTVVMTGSLPGYSKTESGLEYKFYKDVPGTNMPKIGDQVEMHIQTYYKDSALYDSRVLNDNKPVPLQVMPPSFKGDMIEGLMMMTPGDSAVFRVSIDSFKKAGVQLLPNMEEGSFIDYRVVMVSVKSQELVKKETEEKAAQQIGIDDAKLQEYFKANNIKPFKTASGLYYVVTQAGGGEKAKPGQKVTVNYTGKTLDGKVFDSNVDPQFSHVQPFIFTVGEGQVIKGWDEGFLLLNRNSKATLYIPSTLAYGDRGAGGAIGPNEVLVFDVEIIYIGDPAPKPIIIKDGKEQPADSHEGHDHSHDGHKH